MGPIRYAKWLITGVAYSALEGLMDPSLEVTAEDAILALETWAEDPA